MTRASLVVICGLLLLPAGSSILAAQEKKSAKDDDKEQLVEAGYITKLDLKKKVLSLRGYVSTLPAPNSTPTPGGRGGENGRGRNAGSPETADPFRGFKIYFASNTVVQKGATTLTLMDLKLNDFVMIVGNRRGKSDDMDATSIMVVDH